MSQAQALSPTLGATSNSGTASASSTFPKFISEARILEPRVPATGKAAQPAAPATASANSNSSGAVGSSSSGSGGTNKGATTTSTPPLNLCIVINICYYITPLCNLIIQAQPLENIGNETDRDAFLTLQSILKQLDSGKNEPINIFPFLDRICQFMCTSLNDFEEMDISFVWDNVVKLITLVIPPLRELFLGRRSLSLDEHAWISLISRCIHAQFSHPLQTLEDFIKVTLSQQESLALNPEVHRQRTPLESIKNFNAIILSRLPDILAFAVESGHLPPSLRFLDALSKTAPKTKSPTCIKYPASFTLPGVGKESKGGPEEETTYDLISVVTLEGQSFDVAHAYYRYAQDKCFQWYTGSGATHDTVETSRALEKNYLHSSESKKVHPRLLIYCKRGINNVFTTLQKYVTKGGQLRSLGDAAFENAETPEHYDDAKQYYEEAISYDESLKAVLQDKLDALDQIEKNQKAQSYENQADQSLGRKRFKEACDLYKLASRSAVSNSPIYSRIREKEDYMMRIISLEIANHLTEKGEECLKSGMFTQSRENFAQALKLNPNYIHLQSIIQGIDKKITSQTSAQKESEGYQAMKVGRYKYANQLFLESVALVPERHASLKFVLEGLVVLMQGEDALMKQRSGLMALEDKKYAQAIQLITEAISLLPAEAVMEHAFYLCDRAQVYFEMKDYHTSIKDCHEALELRPEMAIAYLRLGSAQFELEQYDEALASYDKALKNDPSLSDQVKVKVRQVNTAKEVQQRKEREAERARIKEEERKKLEEKRLREEKLRKERQEKLAQEQSEKAERLLMNKEEKLMMTFLNRSAPSESKVKAKEPVVDKEKLKKDKAERETQRAAEKERLKAEKEKEKERLKAEKEQKMKEEQEAKEAELQRQREFAAEMEKATAKLREAEREKELERERVRMENERIIAEREKARQEKAANDAKKAKAREEAGTKEESVIVPNPTPKVKGKKNVIPVPVEFPTLAQTNKVSVVEVISTTTTTSKLSASAIKTSVSVTSIPKVPTVRSTSTPVTSTKWSTLLQTNNEDPTPTTQTPKTTTVPVVVKANNGGYVDDFPALNDKAGSVTPNTQTLQIESDLHASAPPFNSSGTRDVPYPNRSSSEPIPSSGELKTVIQNLVQPSLSSQMPALAAAFPSSNPLSDFNSAWTDSIGPSSFVMPSNSLDPNPSSSLLKDPPPGIINSLSSRPDSISKDDPIFHSAHSSNYLPHIGYSSNSNADSGHDVLSSMRSFQPFGISSPLRHDTVLGPELSSDANNVIANLGRPPSLTSMSSFTDNNNFNLDPLNNQSGFSKSFALGGMTLGGLDAVDSNADNRNASRFSYLFPTSGAAELNLHSDLLGDSNNGSSLLGADSGLSLNLSPFGNLSSSMPESSLGFSFLEGPMGGRASSPSLLRAPGLFSDVNSSSQTSRLDKFLGGLESTATPGRALGGFGLSDNTSLLGSSNLLSGLSPSYSLQDPSPPAFSSGFGSFPIGSMLPSSSPTRRELHDMGRRPEEEAMGETAFPSISRWRSYGMVMFRWAMHGSEWAEFCLPLPPAVLIVLGGDSAPIMTEISLRTGCDIKLVDISLQNGVTKGAVFVRGTIGSPSNRTMDLALEMLNKFLLQNQGNLQLHFQQPPQQPISAQLVPPPGVPLPAAAVPTANMGKWGATAASQGFEATIAANYKPSATMEAYAAVESPSVSTITSESSLPPIALGTSVGSQMGMDEKDSAPNSGKVYVKAPPNMKPLDRPALLKIPPHPSGQVRRYLEIPAELIGLVIGAGGKKIKELGTESGCRVQFKTSKASEKEGKPGMLELQGAADCVEKAMSMVWELVQSVGKEYKEVSAQQAKKLSER